MDLSSLLHALAHKLSADVLSQKLELNGKIKKRKTGMIKIECKLCNTQVNSVVFTKHLERCTKNKN
ncbi:hypothetical protein NECID01_1230 [Nematocida sp. AWRm77]|nr:hypothetical protein NECID01_1230 [Nematocida sp. AWRm77]